MLILKAVFFASAFGALPVALRLGPVSLGGLVAGLIFLGSALYVLDRPVIPRSALPTAMSLALFWAVNLAWAVVDLGTSDELRNGTLVRNDVVVWGGMLFLTVVAASSIGHDKTQLASLEKVIRLSSYVYFTVLLWLIAHSAEDTATAQVGIVFFSYYLSTLHQGDKRSILFLLLILTAQIILRARMVVAAELILLVLGQVLIRGAGVSGLARFRAAISIATVLVAAVLILRFSSAFEGKMFGGDVAMNIGGLTVNTSGRMFWWKLAMESALEAPWLGHGSPGPAEMLSTPRWSHPHNDYIRIFHQSGILGCLFWLAYFWQSVSASLRGARNSDLSYRERRWCHATFMTLVGLSLVMITDNAVVYSYVMYPCAVMVGIAVVIQGKQLRRARKSMLVRDRRGTELKPLNR